MRKLALRWKRPGRLPDSGFAQANCGDDAEEGRQGILSPFQSRRRLLPRDGPRVSLLPIDRRVDWRPPARTVSTRMAGTLAGRKDRTCPPAPGLRRFRRVSCLP